MIRKIVAGVLVAGCLVSYPGLAEDSDPVLKADLTRVGQVADELIQNAKSPEDAVRVASALTQAARVIYTKLGGHHLAAAEFAAVARDEAIADKQH